MEYRRHEQPGCGGCLLLLLIMILLFGGGPLLLNFLGVILAAALFFLFAVIAAFWAFTYFVKSRISAYEKSQTETHNTFVYLLVNILVKVSQIDHTVSKEEIATIRRFFQHNLNYSQSQLFWVKDLIKEALATPVSLETLLTELRQNFSYEPRLIVVELIYQLLFTKKMVPAAELQLARNIAKYLNISVYDQQALEAKYRIGQKKAISEEERYYEVFGLQPGADFAEIRNAYRKLSMKYHPDKVEGLGEEFKRVAEEKMKELNAAYAYLQKKVGKN